MGASTLLVVTGAVALFAIFAGALAWAQQQVRPTGPAPVQGLSRKRRSF
jgi:hypothetical protein